MEQVLEKAVIEKLKEEGWEDCFLIDIVINGKKIQVFLDADDGISFKRCKIMSRHLEPILDDAAFMDGKYILEVSSPGVDRPLKLLRQYEKNVGRTIKFVMGDETLKAQLVSVEGHMLNVEFPDPEDKKKKLKISRQIELADIDKALVQVSFK